MDKQQANELIAQKIAQINELVNECTSIADEAGVDFSFDVAGYGMGGWYESGEWQASSHSC